MKKAIPFTLVLLVLFGCKDNSHNGAIASNTTNSSYSDTDAIMDDLASILEYVKNNDYVNLKEKHLVNKADVEDFYINYGDEKYKWRNRYALHLSLGKVKFFKQLKEKFKGAPSDWQHQKPMYMFAEDYSTSKGLKRRKVTLYFGDGNMCYQMELYLIPHEGRRLYAFKKEIDVISYDCQTFKSKMEEYMEESEKSKEFVFESY